MNRSNLARERLPCGSLAPSTNPKMPLNKTFHPRAALDVAAAREGKVHKNTVRANLRFITAVAVASSSIRKRPPRRRRRRKNGVTFCRQQKHESTMNYGATNDEWAHRSLTTSLARSSVVCPSNRQQKGWRTDRQRQTHSCRRKGGRRADADKAASNEGKGRVDDGNNSSGGRGSAARDPQQMSSER